MFISVVNRTEIGISNGCIMLFMCYSMTFDQDGQIIIKHEAHENIRSEEMKDCSSMEGRFDTFLCENSITCTY